MFCCEKSLPSTCSYESTLYRTRLGSISPQRLSHLFLETRRITRRPQHDVGQVVRPEVARIFALRVEMGGLRLRQKEDIGFTGSVKR